MSYVRVPVSLMSDFMAADGGGEYCYVDDWDATLDSFRCMTHEIGGNWQLTTIPNKMFSESAGQTE